MATASRERTGYGQALASGQFRVLLLAQLLVVGGISIAAVALTVLVYRRYVPARSLLRIAAQLAQLAGNAGGGAPLVVIGSRGALLVDAGALVASSLMVRLAIPDHPNTGSPGGQMLIGDSLRGARSILADARLRRLLLLGGIAPMFFVAPEAVAAAYVNAHHAPSSTVGWWLAALPVGLIAGDIAGVRLLSPEQRRRLFAPVAAAQFAPYFAFELDPSIPSRSGCSCSPAPRASTCSTTTHGCGRRPRRRSSRG